MRHWVLLLLIPWLTSGCTAVLWQQTDWDCMPANPPQVHLYDAGRQKDLLVVYNEVSERNANVRTRAYFLSQNQERIVLRKHPNFVSTDMAHGLAPVQVLQSSDINTTMTAPLYAVASSNALSFTLYTNQAVVGSYNLPWYPDPVGRAARIAFTPITVTVDTAAVAAALYLIILSQVDRSPYPYPYP